MNEYSFDEFNENLLYKEIFSLMPPLIEKEYKGETLTNSEEYALEAGFWISQLLSWYHQLRFHEELLWTFTPRKKNNEYGLNQGNYILYLYENFFIRANSIFDKILQLVNFIYEFGISVKNLNYKAIKKFEPQINKDLYKFLNNFYKLTESLRSKKNSYIHQAVSHDRKNIMPELIYFLSENDFDGPMATNYKHFRRDNLIKTKHRFESEFRGVNKAVKVFMQMIFDNLGKEFINRYKNKLEHN